MGERGWETKGGSSYKKKFSQKATLRTKGTYTLRGKDLTIHKTIRSLAGDFKTLGSGNLLKIVSVPDEMLQETKDRIEEYNPDISPAERDQLAEKEASDEWVAANTVDFLSEITLLYGLVEDFHAKMSDPMAYEKVKEEFKDYKKRFPAFSSGFPQGFQYRLKTSKKDEKINGADYVNLSMIWLEDQIDNPQIFPESDDAAFPAKFQEKYISEMFKRMFRIFALMYAVCWPAVVSGEAEPHVNTVFKHFYFFLRKFDLLKKKADRNVFTKTKVKSIIDLDALDKQYLRCEEEIKKQG